MLSSEIAEHNHHEIFARLAETMALLHFDLSKTANDEQAYVKKRKQRSLEEHNALYNSFISVASSITQAAIPALGAIHMGFTGLPSSGLFDLAAKLHEPLGGIVANHVQGKQSLYENSAGLHGSYADELDNSMNKTEEFVRRMLDVNKTLQENHWRTLQEAARGY